MTRITIHISKGMGEATIKVLGEVLDEEDFSVEEGTITFQGPDHALEVTDTLIRSLMLQDRDAVGKLRPGIDEKCSYAKHGLARTLTAFLESEGLI